MLCAKRAALLMEDTCLSHVFITWLSAAKRRHFICAKQLNGKACAQPFSSLTLYHNIQLIT